MTDEKGTTKHKGIMYIPTFLKDDTRFFLPYEYLLSENQLSAMLSTLEVVVDILMVGATIGDILEVDFGDDGNGKIPHRKAKLGSLDVCIISGEAFDNPKDYTDKHDEN